MVTYTKTGDAGTVGHPSIKRVPYLVENTIDISQVNEDAGTADGDFLRALSIPAESFVLKAGIEVVTALSGSATMDLGDGADPDIWVDGDTNATGYSGVHQDLVAMGKVYESADTLDVKVLAAASSAGKIRVWAIMCDISGVDETDRNTTAQHDTEV